MRPVRGRTVLPLGSLAHPASEAAQLIAAGFNRHTFLCGQSGSGKTYTLGVILEQLLLQHDAPARRPRPQLRLRPPRRDHWPEPGAGRSRSDRSSSSGRRVPHRLQVRYGRLPLRQQAMVLSLDPVGDTEAYDALRRLAEALGRRSTRCARSAPGQRGDRRGRGPRPAPADRQPRRRRLEHLGREGRHAHPRPARPDWRAAIADLGEIPTRGAIGHRGADPHRALGAPRRAGAGPHRHRRGAQRLPADRPTPTRRWPSTSRHASPPRDASTGSSCCSPRRARAS